MHISKHDGEAVAQSSMQSCYQRFKYRQSWLRRLMAVWIGVAYTALPSHSAGYAGETVLAPAATISDGTPQFVETTAHFNIYADAAENLKIGEASVELERALAFLEAHTGIKMPGDKITVHVLTSKAYQQQAKSRQDDQAEQARALAVYTVLGMVDQQKATDILSDVLQNNSLGSYDRKDKTLRLRFVEQLDVSTAAHELVHVLQDRITGLEKLTDDKSRTEDANWAGQCLAEGLAELLALMLPHYQKTQEAVPDRGQLMRLRVEVQQRIARIYRFRRVSPSSDVQIEMPPDTESLVEAEMMLPYTYGLLYCVDTAMQGLEAGQSFHQTWSDLVTMRTFPSGTETILDIAAAQEQVVELPSILSLSPGANQQGYQVLEDQTQGEFMLKVWFGHPLSKLKTPFSWAGDRLLLVYPNGTERIKAAGMLAIVFDSDVAAQFAEHWLTCEKHSPVQSFPKSIVSSVQRKGRLLCIQIGEAPEWLKQSTQEFLNQYTPPPAKLTLRGLKTAVQQIIESPIADHGTSADQLLRDLKTLDSVAAGTTLADVLFEMSDAPRDFAIDGLLETGRQLAARIDQIPPQVAETLKSQAVDALCNGRTPVGIVNAIRYLETSGLPDSDATQARERILKASAIWPAKSDALKKVIHQLWNQNAQTVGESR